MTFSVRSRDLHTVFIHPRLRMYLSISLALAVCISPIAGSNNGALCLLTTLDEPTFKRLLGLQKLMNFVLPHFGGLNPKGFRLFQSPELTTVGRAKNIVDGDLIWRCALVWLSFPEALTPQHTAHAASPSCVAAGMCPLTGTFSESLHAPSAPLQTASLEACGTSTWRARAFDANNAVCCLETLIYPTSTRLGPVSAVLGVARPQGATSNTTAHGKPPPTPRLMENRIRENQHHGSWGGLDASQLPRGG